MRLLLVALALLFAPGVAQAQRAESPTVALQRMGVWAQQLAAAQQPALDAYQRCAPLMRQVGAVMRENRGPGAAKALIPDMQRCMADMRVAVTASRDNLLRLGPMPKSVEDALKIDSGALIRTMIASVDGMVEALRVQDEMLTALADGNLTLAMQLARQGQALAGSAYDVQITLFQTLRLAMPLETHKALFDLRILILQTGREIIVDGLDGTNAELTAKLGRYAVELRAAAGRLRANWKRESRDIRDLVVRLDDPSRTAMFAALDNAFETVASTGDEAAALLEHLPAGPLHPADALNLLDRLAIFEIRILEAVRAAGAAASKVS